MHTKQSLLQQLEKMRINPEGTIIVHSSMKSIGAVDGGADTVLDTFIEFMREGLLVFPTHTWAEVHAEQPRFYSATSPSHVGILTELFRQQPKAIRSLHPTHSVAAIGADAVEFTTGSEEFDTPTARASAWGKLLDRQAKILLVGVGLERNTFIHGIEEWFDVPGRMTETTESLVTVLPDGTEIAVPSKRHASSVISLHYPKVEQLLAEKGAIDYSEFGDAKVLVCDAVLLDQYIRRMLTIDPDLFSDDQPLTEDFIETFKRMEAGQ